MKPAAFIIPLLTGLAGCTFTPAHQTDQRTWTSVSCSTYMQFNLCEEEARKVCPEGYDVANVAYSRGEQVRRMDVACKP